jgi:hypothetical protein
MKTNLFACIAVLLFLSMSGCARSASLRPDSPLVAVVVPTFAPEELAVATFTPAPTATITPTAAPCTPAGWSEIDQNLYNVDMEVLYLEDIDATRWDFQSQAKVTADNLKRINEIQVSACTQADFDLVVAGMKLVSGISRDIVAQQDIDPAFLTSENQKFGQALASFQQAAAHLKTLGFPTYPNLQSIITHITQIPTILSYHVPMLHFQ